MTQPRNEDFEQLVLRHQGVVCAVAFAVLRDRARSEEVAQEAFLIAWQKLRTLHEPPVMPGWLCGIARNLARNAARRKKESAMPESVSERAASDGTPLTAVLDREADALAERALATLPELDREVVVLYYRGGGSHEEVASALGVTAAAVRKRLERARIRLRTALGAVETSLAGSRPGAAFTAGCVAALTMGVSTPNAEAAFARPAATGAAKIAIPVAAAGVVGLGIAAAVVVGSPGAPTAASASPPPAPALEAPASASAGRDVPDAATMYVRTIDRATRDALLERITRARTRPAFGKPIGTAPELDARAAPTKVYDFAGEHLDGEPPLPASPKLDMSTLSKASLRYAIRQVRQLLWECYRSAADRLPAPVGGTSDTIMVKLHVAGEPGIATIVETAEISGTAAAARDPEVVECFRETLLSIEMPPLREAEQVDMHYPFTIR